MLRFSHTDLNWRSECGSAGAIPTTEVQLAFSVLGMDVKKAEIEEVIADVDPESTGVVNSTAFLSNALPNTVVGGLQIGTQQPDHALKFVVMADSLPSVHEYDAGKVGQIAARRLRSKGRW